MTVNVQAEWQTFGRPRPPVDRYGARLLACGSPVDARLAEELWRSAAWDYLDACFSGAPPETIRELALVFAEINFGLWRV